MACSGGQAESGAATGVHGLEELCGPSLLSEQALKGSLVAVLRRAPQRAEVWLKFLWLFFFVDSNVR